MSIESNIAGVYGSKAPIDYIRMLNISYGSVCEPETQILLAGDLGFIETGELGIDKKVLAEIEKVQKRTHKILIKQTLESLTPGILGPSSPNKLGKNRSR